MIRWMTSPARARTWPLFVLSTLLAGTLIGCGAPQPDRPDATPSGPTPPIATTTGGPTATPSGADTSPSGTSPDGAATRHTAGPAVAAFLTGARRTDRELHELAGLVNAGITSREITVSPAANAAARRIDLTALARTIPIGMDPRLMRATLLVYSDLSARRAAFNAVATAQPGVSYPRPGPPNTVPSAGAILDCLRSGAGAAARFDRDLAALRDLANSTPAFAKAPALSRAGAEVAIRLALIEAYNTCGDGCGGYPLADWPSLVWRHPPDPATGRSDGALAGITFEARYTGSGWRVEFNAC